MNPFAFTVDSTSCDASAGSLNSFLSSLHHNIDLCNRGGAGSNTGPDISALLCHGASDGRAYMCGWGNNHEKLGAQKY